MRCNWQRWLWGLIPLVMVSWVAIQLERESIKQDLTERAKAALMASGSPWAGVDINGRDAVLTGRAIQDNEPPRAEETVRQVWGVREVENRAILPPKIEPFNWSARRRGNRIRLAGYVPDRATRQTVLGLTKAAMPSLEVVDRMNTARGVPSPDTWLAGLSFALKQLSLLRQGDARFDDLALTISGEAEDTAAFKAVNTALKSGLPEGHQAVVRADHGAGGQPLHVDGAVRWRAAGSGRARGGRREGKVRSAGGRQGGRTRASISSTAWSREKAPLRVGATPRLALMKELVQAR